MCPPSSITHRVKMRGKNEVEESRRADEDETSCLNTGRKVREMQRVWADAVWCNLYGLASMWCQQTGRRRRDVVLEHRSKRCERCSGYGRMRYGAIRMGLHLYGASMRGKSLHGEGCLPITSLLRVRNLSRETTTSHGFRWHLAHRAARYFILLQQGPCSCPNTVRLYRMGLPESTVSVFFLWTSELVDGHGGSVTGG